MSKARTNSTSAPDKALRFASTSQTPNPQIVLFGDKTAVGIIEAKPSDWGHKITAVEEQSRDYAAAKLKWVAMLSEYEINL